MNQMNIEKKSREKTTPYQAEQKCKAILSVWSEKRKPSEICREMGIKWAVLSSWEHRALEGMLNALQPRVKLQQSRGILVSRRLQSLLDRRKVEPVTEKTAIEKRLESIQKRRTEQKK